MEWRQLGYSGFKVPVLSLGTATFGGTNEFFKGFGSSDVAEATRMVDLSLDAGITMFDTADGYSNGTSEEILGKALGSRRDKAIISTKAFFPTGDGPNDTGTSRYHLIRACEASLRRLKTDHLDLYLLHWRGSVPFAETVEAFEALRASGKILAWGVSNLDDAEMQELARVPHGGNCQTDQVLYNLTRRGIEFDLLPRCRKRKMPVMAYSPIEQGRMLGHKTLAEVAKRHDATPAQVALAWLLRQGVIVIPKATVIAHADENLGALGLTLTAADLETLDRAFPPPASPQPLDML